MLVYVVAAAGLGVAGIALYAVESDRPWAQAWIPSVAGALIVGALTVLVLNIVVNTAVDEARRRQLQPLREAADREIRQLREKIDHFLEAWQQVIGELRGDYPDVVREEEGAPSFPELLVSRLPLDTHSLLWSGWGQPNHDRVLAEPEWGKAVEIAGQVKRQSDRIVEWYSEVLGPSIQAAFGQIQEYIFAVVENIPRTGRTDWFHDEGPHREFLVAYRTVWPDDDQTLEAARHETRGMWLAIWQGLREGTSELQAQERDRSYVDPALVGLYDAVYPPGRREDCYLELIASARAVLDLGCGTGRLLRRAATVRDPRVFRGAPPVLIGLDRESSMLAEAKPAGDEMSWEESLIVWQLGDMRTIDVGRRFDLVTMTGRTFQELLTDGDVRMALSNVLRHLDHGGRFAFDVHPGGDKSSAIQVTTATGESVDVVHSPERTIDRNLVEFTTTYTFAGSSTPAVSRNVLRSIDSDHLRVLLEDVGFRIDGWFGNWDHIPFTPSSVAEDLVVATRVY